MHVPTHSEVVEVAKERGKSRQDPMIPSRNFPAALAEPSLTQYSPISVVDRQAILNPGQHRAADAVHSD